MHFTTLFVAGDDEPICACPRNLSPRCGSDGETYANECLLRCKANSPRGRSINLREQKSGPC